MRCIWKDDEGADRCGHSGDVITMLDDMGIPDRTPVPPKWLIDWRAGLIHCNENLPFPKMEKSYVRII